MHEEEYYIEDNDLADLLKDILGDKITDEDIERILSASEDGEITEEDFDRIVDEILAKSKRDEVLKEAEPIDSPETDTNREFVYLSASQDKCPICGSILLDNLSCPNCNLKFSFNTSQSQNQPKK